jgi:hypothetical protein
MGIIHENDGIERRRAKRVYASFVEYCRAEDASSQDTKRLRKTSAHGDPHFVNERIEADTLLLITVFLLDGSTLLRSRVRSSGCGPRFSSWLKTDSISISRRFCRDIDDDRERLVYYSRSIPRNTAVGKIGLNFSAAPSFYRIAFREVWRYNESHESIFNRLKGSPFRSRFRPRTPTRLYRRQGS